jgi:hypothetical protein
MNTDWLRTSTLPSTLISAWRAGAGTNTKAKKAAASAVLAVVLTFMIPSSLLRPANAKSIPVKVTRVDALFLRLGHLQNRLMTMTRSETSILIGMKI